MKINKTHLLIIAVVLVMTSCITRKLTNKGPCPAINIYPAISELVDENNFYSKWTKSIDPEGGTVKYKINYARTVDGLEDPQFYETADNYFLMPNLEEGVWYWRVTAIDDAGNETQSSVWNFTINGESLPQPTDPEDIPPDPSLIVSEIGSTYFTLDWSKYEDRQNPSRDVQYTIYIYDHGKTMISRYDPTRTQWLLRTAPDTTVHTTDTSYTFNNLKSQTLYEWVIIAQNSASQTSLVGSSEIKTGNHSPSQPQLLAPTDEATDAATDVTLSWSASSDPDRDDFKYYVYIDIVKNTNRNVTVEGIEDTHYQPEGIEEGRTYYWFILVKDQNGAATRTQTQAFMTKSDGMNVPTTPLPTDGTQNINAVNPPQLQWEHEKADKPIEYTVYFSSNPKKITQVAEGLTQKAYQIPNKLQGDTKYYWQVEAQDTQSGRTTRSGVWTFKTQTIEPPTQTNALSNSEGTQIELTYDKDMADPSGKKDSYSVKKERTVANNNGDTRPTTTYTTIPTGKIDMKPGTTKVYVLTLEEALVYGDVIKIDYTPGTIQSKDGGKLLKYENVTVTNTVPGEAPLVQAATATSNTVDIRFNKAMAIPPTDAKTQFSIQSGSILKALQKVERTADDTYTLTLEDGQSIAYQETVLISYNKGTIQAQNGAWLESFAGIEATNSVKAPDPQFVSGQTTEDGQTIQVTFDRYMADPAGKYNQFTINVQGEVNNETRQAEYTFTEATLNGKDKKIIELTLNTAVADGQILTLDYTAGDIQSEDGASLESFTDKPVTNNVPATIPVCTHATMTADGRGVEIGFSGDMKAPTSEEANQFGILVNGYVNEITGASLSDNKRIITLELDKPIGKDNEVHLSYTRGTVSAVNESKLESFQNKRVNTDDLQIIWVIKGVGWNYSKIQEAVNEAEDGATITVWPGTYKENIDFGDKEIHLSGSSPHDENISASTIITPADDTSPVVTIDGNQTKTVLEGFNITGGATGLYCEAATAVIRYNFIDATNCAVNLKMANSTLFSNELYGTFGMAVYMTNSEPVIIDNAMGGTYGAIKTVASTPTVYDNKIDSYIKNGIYVDVNSNVKNEKGNLWQVFNVPYANQADVENYTGGATSNTFIPYAGIDEGNYILFERAQRPTAAGTFTLSPATATSNDGQDITIVATYTLAESFSNGTVTYAIDENIDLDDVYIIVNGVKRAVTEGEIELQNPLTEARGRAGNNIHISDIRAEAGEKIVLEIIQSSYLFEAIPLTNSARFRSGYGISIVSDRDGKGTLYTESDSREGSIDIENNLAYIGAEDIVYSIKYNGAPTYTYTVKILKDQMPEKLQTVSEWEIEIRNNMDQIHYFRINQFDNNILQFDEMPNEVNGQAITEQSIRVARFEPKQEIPD